MLFVFKSINEHHYFLKQNFKDLNNWYHGKISNPFKVTYFNKFRLLTWQYH